MGWTPLRAMSSFNFLIVTLELSWILPMHNYMYYMNIVGFHLIRSTPFPDPASISCTNFVALAGLSRCMLLPFCHDMLRPNLGPVPVFFHRLGVFHVVAAGVWLSSLSPLSYCGNSITQGSFSRCGMRIRPAW